MDSEYTISPQVAPHQMGLQQAGPPPGAPAGAPPSTNSLPIGNVTITGLASQGQCLTVSNTLTDANGLGSISYQWFAANTSVGYGDAYVITQSDVNKNISVKASYVDGKGNYEVVSSANTAAVQNVNDKPDLNNIALPGRVKTFVGQGITQAYCSVVQGDGKILVGGTSNSKLAVLRYNSDGSLDKAFSSEGKLLLDGQYAGTAKAIVQQADGKIVVFGQKPGLSSQNTVQIFRLNSDGSIDKSFGVNGQTVLSDYQDLLSATLMGDGIYINTIKSNYANNLIKLTLNGLVDQGFHDKGAWGLSGVTGFRLDSENIYVVQLGAVDTTLGSKFTIAKYDKSGVVSLVINKDDMTFSSVRDLMVLWDPRLYKAIGIDSIGISKFSVNAGDMDFSLKMWEPISSASLENLQLKQETNYLISGYLSASIVESQSVEKNSFGISGVATADMSPFDIPVEMMIQKSGQIIVVGNALPSSEKNFKLNSYSSQGSWSTSGTVSWKEFALARFNADGTLDQNFGISPQDNGSVSYTEGGSPVVLNPLVQVEDLDYQAAGTYAGATLTLKRHGGVNAQDTFSLSIQGTTLNVLANNDITNNGQVIGTFKSEAGALSVAFKGAGATQTVVNQVLQHIQYKNLAFAPPANVQIDWTFSDGTASETGLSNVTVIDLPNLGASLAKHWKETAKTPTDTKKADAVNLTDAIAILKMIVGLNVNSNNTALSPYQAIAADFDQSGDVGLTDAIGVLKMVVGLSAPTPTWKYYDDTKLASAYTSNQSLNPKGWTTTAVISDTGTADSSVKLVGVLTGDVDGSWTVA